MTQLEIEMQDALLRSVARGEDDIRFLSVAIEVARKHVAVERRLCASVVARAAHRWPDNPLVRSVLNSLAEELREGLRG